jgi:hypothetical protein
MSGRSAAEMREELERLTGEHIDSMQAETFVPLSREELSLREERIKRIRELSADYLATLKRIA